MEQTHGDASGDPDLRRKIQELERERDALKEREQEYQEKIRILEQQAMRTGHALEVLGLPMEWDTEWGTLKLMGLPLVAMWIDTTLAGLMAGVQSMVGTERFLLALQSEGRNSVEADWGVFSQYDTFAEGFEAITDVAAVAGWGRWELKSMDRAGNEACFRVYQSWEGRYQAHLGVCWGSAMLAGKLAGYCSRTFQTNCWTEQTSFIARGDAFDEFVVRPSERSIESEIENLLLTDKATAADTAVALQKLKLEVEQRTRVEEELKGVQEALERRFADTVIRELPGSFYMMSQEGRMVRWNERLEEVTGYSSAEIEQMNALDFFPEEEREHVLSKIQEVFTQGVSQVEANFQTQDGELIPHVLTGARIEYDGVLYLVGLGLDITERKQVETALKDSEERFRQIAENIREVFWLFDWETQRVLYVSPAYEPIWGRSPETLYSRYAEWGDSIHPDDQAQAEKGFERILETGGGEHQEYRIIRPDGSERWISDVGYVIKDETGKVVRVVGVAEDITERKRTETELMKVEKLRSLGVLAGGIAHDFNNLLTGIVGNLSLAQLDLDEEHCVYPLLDEMEKAALRARDLTQQLLTFSRGGEPIKSLTSIDALIREAAEFAVRGSSNRCRFDFPDNLWPAQVDPGQIGQVIHNLVLNAVQAMPSGGTIAIGGENIDLEQGSRLKLPEGQYLKLTVQDEGTGIAKENLDSLFDPYFTTKQGGSGLGLAIVYSVIKKHGGFVFVDSEPDQGTTFTLYLPSSPGTATPADKPASSLAIGSGRILVMDDEKYIRSLAKAMLHKMGYETTLAKDGAEAVRLYREAMDAGQPFHVVILDLTVRGGMGGQEAMEQLMAMDPEVKAIVSSGYSDDPVMSHFGKYGFQAAVKKPYPIEELSNTLKELTQSG